jgi:hypothetical protein
VDLKLEVIAQQEVEVAEVEVSFLPLSKKMPQELRTRIRVLGAQ